MTQIKNPKREELIKQFTPVEIDEDIDYTNMIVSILSFSSMIFKNKWAAWASLVATLSGFLDAKTHTSISQGNLMNLTMSFLGLFTIYMPIIFTQKSPEKK
ncbi:unnamed protein product [Pneumocystis jirovecii]|uniref:Protein Asterix n=2 Tax=Pneumocystis jirovecii TaxID=42068 RepID=L0PEP3_PNEJI|nr:uncharacterized protein T551_02382 [Pneumocystis jirovecii RU7]KTW29108.1 hypothetical protein T551_02382 [Pneumocystis jirovecii RU7]CCJ30861.1 unnamed protein product [Pneumocystis jirovecii]